MQEFTVLKLLKTIGIILRNYYTKLYQRPRRDIQRSGQQKGPQESYYSLFAKATRPERGPMPTGDSSPRSKKVASNHCRRACAKRN